MSIDMMNKITNKDMITKKTIKAIKALCFKKAKKTIKALKDTIDIKAIITTIYIKDNITNKVINNIGAREQPAKGKNNRNSYYS